MFLPSVIEKDGRNQSVIDIPSRLLKDRIVYFFGEVSDISANIAIMQLLLLQSQDPEAPIDLYLSSPGGCVYSGLAMKDTIDTLTCKVNTISVGLNASMGAYLLSCGSGQRKALKNSRIMIHSVSSGNHHSTVHDLKINLKETEYLQDKLMEHIAGYTKGKSTLEDIQKKCERDCYLSAEEALEMGLIDEII